MNNNKIIVDEEKQIDNVIKIREYQRIKQKEYYHKRKAEGKAPRYKIKDGPSANIKQRPTMEDIEKLKYGKLKCCKKLVKMNIIYY